MSRPNPHRVASTNIGRSAAYRPLDGRLAIITGASRGLTPSNPLTSITNSPIPGIGAAAARVLASKGCSLLLNYTSDSSESKATELASELQSTHNVTALTVQADMGTPSGPALVITTAKNHFSHPKTRHLRIDIIINNAGLSGNTRLEDVQVEDFHKLYAVNVLGPLLLVQAAKPYLPTDRSGRIVNVSSISSSMGLIGQTVYGGTKAALEAMTRTWARELAERATVNAINPGPVQTDMFDAVSGEFAEAMVPLTQATPLMAFREGVDPPEIIDKWKSLGGRPAYESEIAGIISMLCSEDSGWCTGSVVCANGGMKFTF